MTNESPPNDMRNVWQDQKPEGILMSAEEIHRKAERFERRVFWENALNYFVGLAGVGFCCYLVLHGPGLLFRLGIGMSVAVMLYLVWELHQRSPFRRVPAEMGMVSCLEFHRQELERRRDFHRRFLRFLVPAIPAYVVLMVAFVQLHLRHLGWRLAVANVVVALIFWTFWSQSQSCARKLQNQIDELDALQGRR
ncbi:MAG: hypothetical protein ACLQVM_00735 [Terriglobia bacterium]